MIGPFDFCTTLRSGARLEAGGVPAEAGALFSAVGCCGLEQLDKIAPAEAARAVRPRSRRLNIVVLTTLGGAGEQLPHPDVLQLPQVLTGLLITLSNPSMRFLLLS